MAPSPAGIAPFQDHLKCWFRAAVASDSGGPPDVVSYVVAYAVRPAMRAVRPAFASVKSMAVFGSV
jgi:hypothetical protein